MWAFRAHGSTSPIPEKELAEKILVSIFMAVETGDGKRTHPINSFLGRHPSSTEAKWPCLAQVSPEVSIRDVMVAPPLRPMASRLQARENPSAISLSWHERSRHRTEQAGSSESQRLRQGAHDKDSRVSGERGLGRVRRGLERFVVLDPSVQVSMRGQAVVYDRAVDRNKKRGTSNQVVLGAFGARDRGPSGW